MAFQTPIRIKSKEPTPAEEPRALTGKLAVGEGTVVSAAIPPKQMGKTTKFERKVRKALAKAGEQNFFDVYQTSAVVDYAGTLACLSAVPQGNGDSNRTGDMITPKWLELRGSVTGNTTSVFNSVRIIVFRWRPSNATPPIVTSILQQASTDTAPFSALQEDNYRGGVFDVLHDRIYAVTTYEFQRAFDIRLNLPQTLPPSFIAAGTNGFNQIYILGISDAPTNKPAWRWYSRLVYFDDF